MPSTSTDGARDVRYEPEERPPPALALGLGFQFAMLTVAGIVLTPAILVRAAGGGEEFLSWAAFAALAISGLTTVIQAVRVGRVGSGHVLLMGTSAAFIAVCVTALVEGGPGLLATLVTLSALFQFALSTRLSLLPAFIFVTLIGAIETIGDSVAIQRVSRRKPRATDYRVVQGAVTADGVGNLLSGLAGTVPNTTYSSSVSVTDITGVASRTVGVYIGPSSSCWRSCRS